MILHLPQFKQAIFQLTPDKFEEYALCLFRYQAANNPVYYRYMELIGVKASSIKQVKDIPFLPIELFKTQEIICGNGAIVQSFSSSGTTGANTSYHHVLDLQLYINSFTKGFHYFYGDVRDYCILALLPAYLERKGSSLIYMADQLIQQSQHVNSGFYLYNYEELIAKLKTLEQQKQKCILLGVSFALWDLAEQFPMPLQHTIIMETGGMKGRRKEIIRTELHHIYQNAFGVKAIHSEYGMTELLSQAYSKGEGIFRCPPWMKVLVREVNDPFHLLPHQQTGAINIIDLANVHSCAFIATQDLGKITDDAGDSFKILGRMDAGDVRGCNLLVN